MLRSLGEVAQRPREQDGILSRSRTLGDEILDRFPRAPAAAKVAFMIAYSTPTGTAEQKAASQEAYQRLRREYPRSRHVAEARFREIYTVLGPATLEEYLPAIEEFRRDYPDTDWMKLLDADVRFIRRFREKYNWTPR